MLNKNDRYFSAVDVMDGNILPGISRIVPGFQ